MEAEVFHNCSRLCSICLIKFLFLCDDSHSKAFYGYFKLQKNTEETSSHKYLDLTFVEWIMYARSVNMKKIRKQPV